MLYEFVLQALFLETLKSGYSKYNITARNEHYAHSRQRSAEKGLDVALDSVADYAAFIDTSYLTNNVAFGFTGEYELELDDVAG